MTVKEVARIHEWISVLKDVSIEYPGNINLGTIIRSLEAREEHFYKSNRK